MSAFPIVDGVTVAIPPPEDYVVNFDHPLQRHAIESYVISGIGTALAFLFFLQYLYVKLWVSRKPDGETVQVVSLSSFILGVTGVHAWELPLEKFNEGNHLTFISPILYAVCTACSKMALALFYRGLSPQRWWKWSVYSVFFLVAGYNLAILLVVLFRCTPFKKSWDLTILEGSCVDRGAVYVCTAALGILSDLILLIMPLPMILQLQMPRRQKVGLVVLFVIGSATLVTSVVRLVLLVPIVDANDYTWVFSSAVVWIFVEANLLIICASLTTLRRFFIHVAPKFIGERGSSVQYSTTSKGTRQHPFQTIGSIRNKPRKDRLDVQIEDPGFDLKTIVQAQPVTTEVTAYETDEQPEQMIRHLRRQESLNKFGEARTQTQLWDPRSSSDDEERAIVQTTTVTVVYGPRTE
ncbi:integral membrane protein PTH11 [Fusarium tjaetaba]|uniref:Integral membrane protein PTH11 n=1 Tax=Fusarium tjaetaba TaxID=1567544 RepID=A0A8H5QNA4_9HYPO|nr:integral membrane protein PTH11 [Fusarium tjaetaba]KAF5619825.1 integral membrane protein PTH11 [Fusarium tjaetaba]